MNEATRLTEEGQATIPEELREKYDLEPGDEVIWLDTEDGIVVRKHTRSAGRGLLVPDGTAEETRESIGEELAKRLRARRDEAYDGD